MPQYQGIWTLQDAARLQSQQQWATDPLFENTTLLLQADNAPNAAQNNTFLDSSTNNFTITRNGNTTQGTFTPFSATGWSNYFDGSGDYLSIPDNAAFNLSGGVYTIEAWIYWDGNTSDYRAIIAKRVASTTSTAWEIFLNTGTGALGFYDGTIRASTSTPPVNVWSHVAAVWDGTNINLYLNGIRVLQTAATNTNVSASVVIGTAFVGATSEFFTGYISNVRITKGAQLYTGSTYTVPIAPFTTSVPAGTVSLLTCQSNRFVDNSTNAFAITINGTPSVQAFAPFAPQFQYTPTVIGGSGYFDGTGDYLSAPANTAFQFGTGSFCIEFWYYPTALIAYQNPIDMGYANTGSYVIQNAADGKPYFYSGSVGFVFTSATAYTLNAWNHLVVCRSGTTISMFLNGQRTNTDTNSTNFNANFALGIGGSPTHSSAYEISGYLSNVRLVKGSSVYDPTVSTLTIPTAPLTAITNTSILCNFTNAAITDGTMKNNLETVGNAQVSTSVVKYGSGSMYFDGSGDNCLLPYSPGLHLSGDFTIECWIYPLAYGGMILNMGGGSGIAWASYELVNQTDGVNFAASSANSGYDIGSETGSTGRIGTIPLNAWSHLAVTRSGNVYRGFVNGVQGYTQTLALTPYNTLTRGLAVGSNYTTTWGTGTPTSTINGYLDDLRITKGIARYTANFTPPQVALPRQ